MKKSLYRLYLVEIVASLIATSQKVNCYNAHILSS